MANHVQTSTMRISVLVNDVELPIYYRRSDNQAFVAGVWGKPYTLRVKNLTPYRVEILNSVDGRNTLKDEVADKRSSRGMVVNPHKVWVVNGWRIDDQNTADFIFTDPNLSVETMATGENANRGIIGFALYQEYEEPELPFAFRFDDLSEGKSRSGGRESAATEKGVLRGGDMGTGIGQVRRDVVGRTQFERSTPEPVDIVTIQYASFEWLVQNGIIVRNEPSAFPGNPKTGYGQYLRK